MTRGNCLAGVVAAIVLTVASGVEAKEWPGFTRGMGIGGWLTNYKRFNVLPEHRRLAITEGDLEHFDSYITEADVANIKYMGFDHIRLGFDQIVLEESPGKYRERTFRKIDDFIGWCEKHKMNVVLNLHKAIGNYCDIKEDVELLDDAGLQRRFIDLWMEIERRYHDIPGLAFELLNEVRNVDPGKWNDLADRTIRAIRAKNPDRWIVVGSTCWNSPSRLKDLKVWDDTRVAYTFHMYSPMEFTHQRGVLQADQLGYNREMHYPTEDVERYRDYNRYRGSKDGGYDGVKAIDRSFLARCLRGALDFEKDHPDKVLWNGEFGTIRHAPPASRVAYMRDVVSICKEAGIPWCVWNYLSTPNDGNRFSLVDDDTRKILSPELLNACLGEPPANQPMPSVEVRLKDEFPFGVFWAWERNEFNYKFAGLTHEQYAEKELKLLKDMNCDAVWFVHGPGAKNAPWFMPMMEKYGVKGMVASELIALYYDGEVSKGLDFVDKRAANTAKAYSQYKSLLGYVLKDEPHLCSVQHSDYFYGAMRRADPSHEAAVIAMPPQYQTYIEDTQLSVVCTDIYHFGGDKSVWIPHPARESRRTFRRTVHNVVTAAEKAGKHAWIMPMVFANVWGPNYWDAEGRRWALPGSYEHWRMPTPAEASWQVWEAVRGGAKGVLFYLFNDARHYSEESLASDSPDRKRMQAALDEYGVVKKYGTNVLVKAKKEIDPGNALTKPGGDPTPQFLSIGGAFGALAPHKRRLLASRRALFPVFFPEGADVKAQTFEERDSRTRLGVLVNDDVEKAVRARIRVAKNVVRVRDLNGGELPIADSGVDKFNVFEVALAPGGGAILEAEFTGGYAGFPLLREDFSRGAAKGVIGDGVAEKTRYTMFGIGADWQLRLKKGADASKSAFTLSKLTNAKGANNTVFMNLNRMRELGTVFLDLHGDFKGLEVTAVLDPKAVEEKTDVLHTGEKAATGANAAAPRRVVWRAGDFLPAVMPMGATGLEFRLGDKDDSLREVRLWFVPDADKIAAAQAKKKK